MRLLYYFLGFLLLFSNQDIEYQKTYDATLTEADVLCKKGKFISAIQIYKEALQNHPEKEVDITLAISKTYIFAKSVDSTQHYLKKAEQLLTTNSTVKNKATFHYIKAKHFNVINQIDSATVHAITALDLATVHQLETIKFHATFELGTSFLKAKNYQKAKRYLDTSLQIALQLKDTNAIALAHYNLGLFNTDKKQFAIAEEHFEKAISMFNTVENNYHKLVVEFALQRLYMLSGNFKKFQEAGPKLMAMLNTFEFDEVTHERVNVLNHIQNVISEEDAVSLSEEEIKTSNKLLQEGSLQIFNKDDEAVLLSNQVLKVIQDSAILEKNLPDKVNDSTKYFTTILSKDYYINKLEEETHIKDTLYKKLLENKQLAIEEKYQTKVKENRILTLENENIQKDLIVAEENKQKWLFAFIALLSLVTLAFIIFYFINKRKQLIQKNLIEKNKVEIEKIQALEKARIEKIEALKLQRTSIGDNLHDEKAKILSEIAVALKHQGEQATANEIEQVVAGIRDLSHQLRFISFDESSFKDQVINTAIKYHSTSFEVQLEGLKDIDWTQIHDAIKYNVLLIIKECINNTYRHAETNAITITFSKDARAITLTIKDKGKGFSTSEKFEGIGLASMQSRVTEIKGTLHIQSTPGNGTNISICIPT